MHVTEERLSEVLSRRDHAEGLLKTNPVAALILESMATAHPRHADSVRHAGGFLLDLLQGSDGDPTHLSLPVAMQVLSRDEFVPLEEMQAYLGEMASRDLLLGLSAQALLAHPSRRRRRRRRQERKGEREAVTRTLYLLVRMFETQEEVDRLDQTFEG